MTNARMTICVMVVVLVAASPSKADLVGYVAGDSQLVSINFTTGDAINLGPSGTGGFLSIETSPIDESVYVTTNNGGFYQIDTISGQANQIADTGHLSLNSLAFAPNGDLFAVDSASNDLVSIDVETGEVALIGSLSPYGLITAFAIDNSGRAIGWDSDVEWLFEIDLTYGLATSLGYLPGSFDALDYGPDGVLYGWDLLVGTGGGGRLYSIDVANVQLDSYLGQFYPGSMYGFTLIPEPSTLLLLGLGAVLLRKRH